MRNHGPAPQEAFGIRTASPAFRIRALGLRMSRVIVQNVAVRLHTNDPGCHTARRAPCCDPLLPPGEAVDPDHLCPTVRGCFERCDKNETLLIRRSLRRRDKRDQQKVVRLDLVPYDLPRLSECRRSIRGVETEVREIAGRSSQSGSLTTSPVDHRRLALHDGQVAAVLASGERSRVIRRIEQLSSQPLNMSATIAAAQSA